MSYTLMVPKACGRLRQLWVGSGRGGTLQRRALVEAGAHGTSHRLHKVNRLCQDSDGGNCARCRGGEEQAGWRASRLLIGALRAS